MEDMISGVKRPYCSQCEKLTDPIMVGEVQYCSVHLNTKIEWVNQESFLKLRHKKFLDACLKPEEIAGAPDIVEKRVRELTNWFRRYLSGHANPKWLEGHTYELVYLVAKERDLE